MGMNEATQPAAGTHTQSKDSAEPSLWHVAGEQSAEKIERSIRKNEQKKKNLMKKMACGQAFDRRNACAWTNNSRISLAGALSMQIV